MLVRFSLYMTPRRLWFESGLAAIKKWEIMKINANWSRIVREMAFLSEMHHSIGLARMVHLELRKV